MAADTSSKSRFAQRRPGWELQSLNSDDLELDSFEPLQAAAGRQACPKCGKSRALYCRDCLIPFTNLPVIELPFQLHIITHAAEAPTKATGVQAAVLCPKQVSLHSLQQLPELDAAQCVVMFPSDDALLPDQIPLEQLKHVIIIDSKWRKAKELNQDPRLDGMRRVKLPGNPRSSFWRFHTQGTTDEGVCTIEAIHLLLRALADRLPQPATYWDNLLYYYAYQHKVVEQAATERAAKRQLAEQRGGYVKQKKRRQLQLEKQLAEQQQQQQQEEGEQEEFHKDPQQDQGQQPPQQQQQHCKAVTEQQAEQQQVEQTLP